MTNLPHHHEDDIDSLISHEVKEEMFEKMADLFAQLSDPTRIKILRILCHCEECVINIAALINMSSPAVSHHLRFLKQSSIITSRRIGKEVHYHLADNEKAQLVHKMIDAAFDIHCEI